MNKNQIDKNHLDRESVFLRQAQANDISALEQLLNRCYRQTAGWTNEADLVDGIRITQDELARIIENSKHYLFVYPKTTTGERGGEETGELLGCIAVDIKIDADINGSIFDKSGCHKKAYIGMFAVHPELQGQGVGNVILDAAETFAQRHLQSEGQETDKNIVRLTLSILSHRPELLSYYERRGYKLTGVTMPFPADGNNGEPKRQDLELLELEKIVNV